MYKQRAKLEFKKKRKKKRENLKSRQVYSHRSGSVSDCSTTGIAVDNRDYPSSSFAASAGSQWPAPLSIDSPCRSAAEALMG